MATQQTPEQIARELIAILAEANADMPAQALRTKWGFERPGFAAGYEFAKTSGWIKEPHANYAGLTQLGFDEA